MATHAGMLLAYDTKGNVVGTLDYLVQYNETGEPLGLVDFATHEEAGGKLTDVWNVEGAKGSGSWPEWLGAGVHDFRVELDKGKRIAALVHKTSGSRRERAAIEAVVADRITKAEGSAADIRDIVGGPDRALQLDEQGLAKPWTPPTKMASLLVPHGRAYFDTPTTTPDPGADL